MIGLKYDSNEIQKCRQHWPFDVIKVEEGNIKVHVENETFKKDFYPWEIPSFIISYLKDLADKHF
jgi:molecular chaperone DnaK (HSP70)